MSLARGQPLGFLMGNDFEDVEWWSVETGTEELKHLEEVIKRGFPNEGPVTLDLEAYFRDYFGVKHAILTTSGTIALFLALKSLGIGPGDKVGVPNLTFIATANAVSLTGATPVLIETLEETLCIDFVDLQKTHNRTPLKAVIPVHVSGRSAFTSSGQEILNNLNIKVIEDAAEAFGSRDPVSRKLLGTIGHAGAFSFSPNKIITSGQGGLVVTSDDNLASKIREIKDQGRSTRGTGGDDTHKSIGFNFKFTDLQAAVLFGQIKKLDWRIQHLTETYESYKEQIQNLKLLEFQTRTGEFPLWPEIQANQRINLEIRLDAEKVGYRKIWHPLSTQVPYFTQDTNFKISENASKKTLWLPSAFTLTKLKIDKVIRTLNAYEDQT